MAGRRNRKSSSSTGILLANVLALLLCLVGLEGDLYPAQTNESMQGESPDQAMDMDHHGHAEGAVEAMTPHQRHAGPHMKWTMLRTPNAEDSRRADQIVQTLRQALAK